LPWESERVDEWLYWLNVRVGQQDIQSPVVRETLPVVW